MNHTNAWDANEPTTSSAAYDEPEEVIAINLSPCSNDGDLAGATSIELKQTDERPLVIL